MFDARGGSYDDAMTRWPLARSEELGFVLDLARPRAGEVLLDVPSGGGYLSDHLPPGVDYRPLETSTSFAERGRRRGLHIVSDDITARTVPHASVDLLVSIAGVHHEPDLRVLLREWHRVLRPGGRMVVADVVDGSAPARFLDDFVGRHNGTGHDAVFLGADLAKLARDAGLVVAEVVDGSYHWWFDDEAHLAAYCTALFGLTATDPGGVLDAVRTGPGIEVTCGRVGLRWGLRALVARRPEVEERRRPSQQRSRR